MWSLLAQGSRNFYGAMSLLCSALQGGRSLVLDSTFTTRTTSSNVQGEPHCPSVLPRPPLHDQPHLMPSLQLSANGRFPPSSSKIPMLGSLMIHLSSYPQAIFGPWFYLSPVFHAVHLPFEGPHLPCLREAIHS